MEKTKRASSWIGALVIVALLCVGVFIISSNIAGKRSMQLRSAVITPALAGQTVEVQDDNVIYYDGSMIHALDSKAKQIWSYAAGADAGFSASSGGVAAWSGSMLSILEIQKGETLFSGNMEDNVLDVRVGSVYSAVQIGEEHNSTMVILESGGRQVEKIEFNNRTVLDFGFFNNDSLFWVMMLNTEGTVPVCTISTYRPGKMRLGDIEDNQQVLYEVVFQSSQIRAVGTTHIKEYDYTAKENVDNRTLVYGWYLMSMDDDTINPMMAFVPMDQADGSTGISDVRMIRGQVQQSVRLPYPATRVLVNGDAIYAFNGQYVMVCHMGETTPKTYVLPLYVESVLDMTDNKTCVVTSGGYVYLIPMP